MISSLVLPSVSQRVLVRSVPRGNIADNAVPGRNDLADALAGGKAAGAKRSVLDCRRSRNEG
jgi:hypothetical protein